MSESTKDWTDSEWFPWIAFGVPAVILGSLWLSGVPGESLLWGCILVGLVLGAWIWVSAKLSSDSDGGKAKKDWPGEIFGMGLVWCFAGLLMSGLALGLEDFGFYPGRTVGVSASPSPSPTVEESLTPTPTPTPCLIKGNISFNTGEKIYHLPGVEFYDETVIEPEKGEKLFCSEQQAIKEGWRKAKPAPPPPVQQGYYEEGCEDFETFEQAYDAGYECDDLPSEDNLEDEEGYEDYEY